MLGGSSILRLVCLLSFLWPHVASRYRTIYTENSRLGQAGRGLKRNAFYSSSHRANYSWLSKINPMAFSYSRRNKLSHSNRRQDIYGGSEFDWEGFPVEDTPTWPPDYNSWPQTVTQAPPQYPLVPTQAPLQGPYQVPPVVPTQISVPVVSQVSPSLTDSQARPPFSTSQSSRIWPSRVKPQNDMNYLTTVKGELKGLCQVQHAPFAKGSGAVDSRYGLQCLSMMLHTTALEPTSYDAVVFNFGMHDIDYSKLFPEEFVPLEEYGQNLMKIKELLLQSGAQVAFALTTPVPIAGRRNKRVVNYNKEARRIMEDGRKVEIVDLHSAVIHECGEPPYETCSIMKRPRDVHFNPKGYRLLGVKVGATFRSLLSKAKPRGQFSPPKVPELSAREGLASFYLHDDSSTFCPDMVTRCPTRTTCCENLLSLTGYGCCMEPDAVNCPDNWHCCPRGTHCSPDCNFRSCRCLFPFHPAAASKLSKETKESKMKSKFHSKSHSTSGRISKESEDKKEVPKTKKGKKKKNKAKDKSATKSRKKASGKSKPKLKLKDKKNKKHKQGRKDKAKEKTKKSRNKENNKDGKSQKLKKIEKTKAIHKINKHVFKAHRTYQQNNFHPTTKQHLVTLLDNRLGVVTKHKQNIKFSHTWGRKKHQKLSFKSNGSKKKGLKTDASMADELKHLIVKHRKEKLRRRLKLRVNGHTKHKHGSDRNRFIDRRKTTARTKGKGILLQPTHTRNIFKHRDSNTSTRHKNVKTRKTPHKVKAANKVETNKSRHEEQLLGHQNLVSVNIFNNLRQILHEKVLAKEHVSLKLNSFKRNGKIAEHFATNTSDNKEDELGKTRFDNILKTKTATDSSEDLQRTPLSSNESEPQHMTTVKLMETSDPSSNASTSLVEHSQNSTSNSSSAKNDGEPSNSRIVSVSKVLSKEGRIQPQVDERESRKHSSIITNSNSTESGKDERTAGENEDRLVKANGKVNHGTRQQNKTLATNGAKKVSSANIDSVRLVKGIQNQAKADWAGSGSGLEADEISIGSASDLEMVRAGAKSASSADKGSVTLEIGMGNETKADWVGSGSGLEANKISIGSASGPEMASASAKNDSSTDTRSVRLKTGMHHEAKADWVASGNGLESDEFSIGSGSDLDMATKLRGEHGDSNIDEHIKAFLGGDDNESSTTDLEKNETTKALPESSANDGEGSSKSSPLKKLNAESADAESFSGTSFEEFSSVSGSDLHFGGEDDNNIEEKPEYGDQKYFYSSGRDDSYQSGLFLSSGTTSLNQWQTLKTTEDKQSLKKQYEDYPSDNSLLPDLSQMSYNDWDDARETYSGLGSGNYESSSDHWGTGSGVPDGFSSESLSTDTNPISSMDSIHQSISDSEDEHDKNEIVSGEGMNLQKRNHVFTSNSGSQLQLSEDKTRRSKLLQHTEKTNNIEKNESLSWEDKELKQLLYWLSLANDDDNKHFNQIMAYKDIASGYSRLHNMLLQKMLPRFFKGERDEVKRRKVTLRPSLVSSASGSETESSNMLNFMEPEFIGDAENVRT